MIQTSTFEIKNPTTFIENLIEYSRGFDVSCVLNSNGYTHDKYSKYSVLAAFGVSEEYEFSCDSFDQLSNIVESERDWLFGHFNYNLKNQLEQLSSRNPDRIDFPLCYFFKPQILLKVVNDTCTIFQDVENQQVLDALLSRMDVLPDKKAVAPFQLKERTSKADYLKTVATIKDFIKRGDIYEMNYCVEYYGEDIKTDPYALYSLLNKISPNPFSSFYKNKNQYLICASPERFICKRSDNIISQPIKGTSARGSSESEDLASYQALKDCRKENSENIMITDLVRNDLSKIAQKSSVKVEELCEIYAFPQVFQMISTVKAVKKAEVSNVEVIKSAFPMGSMTGAPKISATKIIDELEQINRGLYSGSVGYFDPSGDFDFNVVIRSLQYNESTNYLSYMAGSAITWASVAEKEYDECRLKALSLEKMFG